MNTGMNVDKSATLNELNRINDDQYRELSQDVRREIFKVDDFLNNNAAQFYDYSGLAKALYPSEIFDSNPPVVGLLTKKISTSPTEVSLKTEVFRLKNLFQYEGLFCEVARPKDIRSLMRLSGGCNTFKERCEKLFCEFLKSQGLPITLSSAKETFTQYLAGSVEKVEDLSSSRKMPLAEGALSLDNLKLSDLALLEQWIVASDTITIWKILANSIGEPAPDLSQLDSLKSYIKYASNLAVWMGQHKEKLSQLQVLKLSKKQLTSLPKEIGLLSQLQVLKLFNNRLTSLPKEIGQLSKLQVLTLIDNQLTSLPKEIGQLSLLQNLYLNSNQLTLLPKEVWQLPQLQNLYLNNNRLTSLPKEIGLLSQLQHLYLSDGSMDKEEVKSLTTANVIWL